METRVGKCLCGEPERAADENGKPILVRCPLYVKLLGKDPQTGDPIEEWGCSIAWLPVLLIEGTQRMNEMGAAIESLRNEICVRADNAAVRRIAQSQGTELGTVVVDHDAPQK